MTNNAKGQQREITLKIGLEAFSADSFFKLFVNFLVVIHKYVHNSVKMYLEIAEFTLIWGHLFKFSTY